MKRILPTIACVVLVLSASGSATAAAAVDRPDGIYDFMAAPHTGTLAVKSTKGGLLFEVSTVSPKGATCEVHGKAIGGSVLTYRSEETVGPLAAGASAGFRMTIGRDQITISGLLGRVSESSFCGQNALMTGVYKRSRPLDVKTAASLARIEGVSQKGGAVPPAPAAPAAFDKRL